MKIVTAENGKRTVKISKSEWESIGKKHGWLAKYSQSNMDFYHASNSGSDNSTLDSLRQGIKTDMAQGYGQGSGFYVWTNKQDAIRHSQDFGTNNGYPIIITISVGLTPENFDLDHEVMSSLTGNFISSTWDQLFKRLPEGSVNMEGRGVIDIASSKKLTNGNMQFFISGTRSRFTLSPNTESSIGVGESFGSIFNAIQKNFPQASSQFEQQALNDTVQKGGALKYVGQSIRPSKIEALVNNQWVDVTSQSPSPQQGVNQQHNSNLPERTQQTQQNTQQQPQNQISTIGFISNYIGKLS